MGKLELYLRQTLKTNRSLCELPWCKLNVLIRPTPTCLPIARSLIEVNGLLMKDTIWKLDVYLQEYSKKDLAHPMTFCMVMRNGKRLTLGTMMSYLPGFSLPPTDNSCRVDLHLYWESVQNNWYILTQTTLSLYCPQIHFWLHSGLLRSCWREVLSCLSFVIFQGEDKATLILSEGILRSWPTLFLKKQNQSLPSPLPHCKDCTGWNFSAKTDFSIENWVYD